MELTQLRYFCEVYRSGNIRAASERLNVTQQAVSKQIKNLEEELNVTLFERCPRGVKATVYADRLARKAEHFLPELDGLVYDLRMRDTEPAGEVRLGIQCWQMSSGYVLRYGALKEFQKAYPRIGLTWRNLTPPQCVEGLFAHEIDLAVTGMPADPSGLELTPLRPLYWYMIMSAAHPLAKKKRLTEEDLAGQRVIIAEDETGARGHILRTLAEKKLEKARFIGLSDFIFDIIGQQIEGENALMLATGTALGLFNPERFAVVPYEGDRMDAELYLVRLEGAAYPPAEQCLYQYLLDRWGEKIQR